MVAWNDVFLVLCPLEVKSYYEYFLHEKHKVHDSSLYDIPAVPHVGIVSPAHQCCHSRYYVCWSLVVP